MQDWDKPEYVQDPDATKPDDWDDDTDGEWEAPMIPNPDYQVCCAAVFSMMLHWKRISSTARIIVLKFDCFMKLSRHCAI